MMKYLMIILLTLSSLTAVAQDNYPSLNIGGTEYDLRDATQTARAEKALTTFLFNDYFKVKDRCFKKYEKYPTAFSGCVINDKEAIQKLTGLFALSVFKSQHPKIVVKEKTQKQLDILEKCYTDKKQRPSEVYTCYETWMQEV